MSTFLQQPSRFLFFTGKGGVGKTALAGGRGGIGTVLTCRSSLPVQKLDGAPSCALPYGPRPTG